MKRAGQYAGTEKHEKERKNKKAIHDNRRPVGSGGKGAGVISVGVNRIRSAHGINMRCRRNITQPRFKY